MSFVECLYEGVRKTIEEYDFKYFMESCIEGFLTMGISIDRMQIPMSKVAGLRHPMYAVIVMTYEEGNVDVVFRTHQDVQDLPSSQYLKNTPYSKVLDVPNTTYRHHLDNDSPFSLLQDLKKRGYREYMCANMMLPQSSTQLFSMATKQEQGFCDDAEEILRDCLIPLSLALFATYQSNVTRSLSATYLGRQTGQKVLDGEIYRGKRESVEAGIMFCDVRGFTAMSERLGSADVVTIMNEIFQIVEDEVVLYQGEILKFIGDALLILFPKHEESDRQIGENMIRSALLAVQKVEALGREKDMDLSVGFGCHIGEVLYGNIGTKNRLDFTVMGPAVNLTSRLESMCKSLDAQLTVSPYVAVGNEDLLTSFGKHSLKGIAEPVEIWGCPVNS